MPTMKLSDRRNRIQFYKNAVIENYGTVVFTDNLATNISRAQNHLRFKKVDGCKVNGHINWYSGKSQITKFGGNACVVIYVSCKPETSNWTNKPFTCCQEKSLYKVIFSKLVDNSEVGTEEAAQWTKTIFKEIAQKLKVTL